MNKKIMIYDVNESFTHIKMNGDLAFAKKIIDSLSVYEEGFSFNPAFRQGFWDGKKHFFEILDNQIFQIPKGLIDYIIKDLQQANKEYSYKKISYSDPIISKEEFHNFIISLNTPFMPYDYQEQAALDSINNRRLVLSAATSCLDPKTKVNVEVSQSDLKFLEDNFY